MSTKYPSPHPTPVRIGVIGGSGVYKLTCLQDAVYYEVDTPFGKPSGPICVANIKTPAANGQAARVVTCAFLPRHGAHHSFNPSEINYRANICALKILGVEYLVAINAVGSLHEDYKPGDLVLVDQLIDKTVKRESTFFSGIGVVAHADFAFPTSQALSKVAFAAICETFPNAKRSAGENWKALGISIDDIPIQSGKAAAASADVDEDFTIHASGTLVVMEGPQFSTRAESLSNKHALGGHLIGMTTCPEAKLAREAEMVYCTVAMVTDNDAWQHAQPHVDVAAVMVVVKANSAKAQLYPPAILTKLAALMDAPAANTAAQPESEAVKQTKAALAADPARSAMQYAVMGNPEHFSAAAKEALAPILAANYPAYRS